jgi:ATP-dependent Zn protease
VENERRHTAIHESAHAVIGRALGLTCGSATIAADEETGEAGFSICADPLEIAGHWDQRERYRDLSLIFRGRILAYMAGSEAERIILGECQGGDGDDRRQIEMMAESDESDFDAAQWSWREARMRETTRRLVRHHRAAIERLACALEARETLSGDEIDALILKPHRRDTEGAS